MTDAEIVARMRKALETWSAQAEGARKSAGYDMSRMNVLGAIDAGRDAVVLEALAAFIRQCLDAD
jgi:hypothetical protein